WLTQPPIVTTITKTANKEETPKEADAALKANILDFCEEHYEDILPVIMDKICRDKRKEVHPRLDFGENPKKSRRVRDGSQNSSAGTLPARYRDPSERPEIRDRLKYNDEDVFDRVSHRRQSAFDRLSNTYSPSTTNSGLNEGNSRDRSHSRGRSRRRGSSSIDRPRDRNRPCGIEESYSNTRSSYRAGDMHGYHARDKDHFRNMKRERENESPLSRVSKSGTSDGGRWKTRTKRRKPADEEELSVPWTCEDVDPFTPRIRNVRSSRKTRMPNNVKNYDGTGDPEDHLKIFQVATQGETAVASKKKVHTLWKSQDQSKRQTSKWRSDFRNQPKDGRGSNKFTPLIRTPKEIFVAESGKFKPPPPMVTPVEKRSSIKFCEFQNDKGHNTDECMQLRKQIEEFVRAGKLSHFIKEIR
nr:reverse transcriptase domain-containing protein [Tanacetum cinerariifolium]